MTDATTDVPATSRWIDLAREADFALGRARARPSACEVEFDGARIKLQPRVMQVLVALTRARGELVSRDALVDSCWGGLAVSDDAINRCIQRLRRLAEAEAPDIYSIETLPRLGYRLTAGAAPAAAPARPAAPEGVTLAVLPFVNMSADPEQEYFSDGLSEELLNQLAQVKSLRVPARTSCFVFKGKNLDIKVAGEMLGVSHVLEGSVRKAGDQIRITAQLINCATGYHLWSATFDRRLDDVFAIQEDVARSVTQALGVTLGLSEAALGAGEPHNPDAYDKYLRARALYHQQGPSELVRAIQIFKEAVAIEPGFVLAWRGLFAAHVDALIYLAESAEEAFPAMAEAGGRILALAPDAWWSHALRADLYTHQHNWAAAETAARAAYDAAPATEVEAAFTWGRFLASVGRVKEGLEHVLKLRRADPLSLRASSFVQVLYDFCGRHDEAQAEYERSKDLPGDREISEFMAFLRALRRGDAGAARTCAERVVRYETVPMQVFHDLPDIFDKPQEMLSRLKAALADPAYQDSTRRMKIALWAGQYGDDELAMSAMRRHGGEFEGGRLVAIWNPVLKGVRRTPAFREMLGELGLADYWRATGRWGDFARAAGDDFECI
jgi:TolB-like protein/tetratricopeptide (TPR) repeat protein